VVELAGVAAPVINIPKSVNALKYPRKPFPSPSTLSLQTKALSTDVNKMKLCGSISTVRIHYIYTNDPLTHEHESQAFPKLPQLSFSTFASFPPSRTPNYTVSSTSLSPYHARFDLRVKSSFRSSGEPESSLQCGELVSGISGIRADCVNFEREYPFNLCVISSAI
jgi:hypothetical protein